jgi:F420-0:gamma-glutamyl ligase
MAKIKNVSGVDRILPNLGGRLCIAGAIVEVADGEVYGYTCQETNWKPADKAAETAHRTSQKEEQLRVAVERGEVVQDAPEEG